MKYLFYCLITLAPRVSLHAKYATGHVINKVIAGPTVPILEAIL
jgi:hypothetical protein